jgi:hypothetical protein
MAENKPTFVDEEEESPDLSNPQVVDKYKAAADVANRIHPSKLFCFFQPGCPCFFFN